MKKIILLISLFIGQSTHTALQTLTPYRQEIAYGIGFCVSELACKKLSIPYINLASTLLSHAMILNKHKNYSVKIHLGFALLSIVREQLNIEAEKLQRMHPQEPLELLQLFNHLKSPSLDQYQTMRDRLTYLLMEISSSYCGLERSPLFFHDSNVNLIYRWLSSMGYIYLLGPNSIELKSMHVSYALSKALGILKTPFPSAYTFLPSNITHYAHQSTAKARVAVLCINILQNIAYVCFIRFGFLNMMILICHCINKMMGTINNRVIAPLVNKFTHRNRGKATPKHKINLVPYISCIASGIILFFCCDKMLQLLYQKGFICVQDAVGL